MQSKTNFIGRNLNQILGAVLAVFILQVSASAATFTVTNTNDSGPGSLRQAIDDANGNPGFDLINFNIPPSDPNCSPTTGVCTIRPQSNYPFIANLEIDGYTQPGASVNTLAYGTNAVLKIELRGRREVPGFPASKAFVFFGGPATIKGLIINNFEGNGVEMEGNGRVLGCFFGTDATGTVAIPNGRGCGCSSNISFAGDFNFIGIASLIEGAMPADRNIISGNVEFGINSSGGGGSDAHSNFNQIQNNLIGTKADGVSPLGNGRHGIFFNPNTSASMRDNLITNNVIAFNGEIGVNIADGGSGTSNPPLRTRILANSIHSNGNLGINLGQQQGGVDGNDPCDGDGGVNNGQNYPVITSSVISNGNFFINGSLNSNAGGTFTIQFFANDACDASGNGEGKTYLGQITVNDADNDCAVNFSASFPVPVGAGSVITSTATDAAGNTSEFSSCSAASPSAPFDFDGDGKTDASEWNPTSRNWMIRESSTNNLRMQFDWGNGSLGDLAVPRDYDGDLKTDIAVFRPSEGNWYIIQSNTNTIRLVNWGASGDIPVPADYDGDLKTDIAVFRPSEGNWYIINSQTNTVTLRGWGASTDTPVPGYYDTDSKADIAVYRAAEGNWYIIQSTTNTARLVNWGTTDDRPILADFDGDGRTDIAVFRPAGSTWFIIKSGGGVTVKHWGQAGDLLVPGDYDGDKRADIAVYRPAGGEWWIINSGSNTLTLINLRDALDDVPAPSTYTMP